MSADAVAVFHPVHVDRLKPFLDLDDESDESDGLYAEELDDGTFLVHTFQPFEVFAENPSEARVWLSQFGDALPDVHDDPRGLLFFPDTHEPAATSYDAVVAEMADKGVFISTMLHDEPEASQPSLDLGALQALQSGSSFEIGRLFQDVQQQLVEALGVEEIVKGGDKGPSTVVDEEFEPDE